MTAHERFKKIWLLSKFGVKTIVFKSYSQQMIEYILKTPDYNKVDKIESIIEHVKSVSKIVKNEVVVMNKLINKI